MRASRMRSTCCSEAELACSELINALLICARGQWEVSWSAPVGAGNPFEVEMFVDLTAPGAAAADESVRVRGFVDSQDGSVWRARYMPPTLGVWSYTTRCAAVPELDGHSGNFVVVAPQIGTQDRGP